MCNPLATDYDTVPISDVLCPTASFGGQIAIACISLFETRPSWKLTRNYLCTLVEASLREHVLTAISYCILMDLGLNTLRGMMSAQWQDKAAWGSSNLIKTTADTARAAVLTMADLHDQFLAARDPVLTLRLACAFSALSVLGSFFRCLCHS